MNKELIDLIEEAMHEAEYEGFHRAIFDHSGYGHTVETRSKMLNHGRLKEKILKEIKHALSSPPPSEAKEGEK